MCRLSQGKVDHAAHVQLFVAVVVQFQQGLKFVGGAFGDHTEGASGGILAVKGPLWPPEDFHPLYVDQVGDAHPGPTLVDPVKENTDTGIYPGVGARRADSPDPVGGGASAGPGGDLQVWRILFQAREIIDAAVLQKIAAKSRDRHGHVLQSFGTPAGGNQHLLQYQYLSFGGLFGVVRLVLRLLCDRQGQ